MRKNEDKDTRYFIDLDLRSGTILGWDYDNRFDLIAEKSLMPSHHRVYISRGQYNKLEEKHRAVSSRPKT
ncbi:MAG: hypothetical protein R3247_15900 [Rhodothermales bacterium]|nr:hypothetical protein [Rhodothermales bacterium]